MYAKALSYAALGLACAWGGWAVQGWRMEAKLSDLKTEYAQAQAAAVEKAHAETIRLQGQKDAAERLARKRQSDLARDAAAAGDALVGLSHAADSALRAAQDSIGSCMATASALRSVFGECAAERVEVAREAAGHLSDKQTLTDAFPK